MKIRQFLCLFFMMSGTMAAAGPLSTSEELCERLFEVIDDDLAGVDGKPFEGIPVSDKEFKSFLKESGHKVSLPPNANIFMLGRGLTADVFRIHEDNGEEYILKFYTKFGPSVGTRVRGEKVLQKDLVRLDILREAAEELPEKDRLSVVSAETIGPRVLKLRSIRGVPLSRYLKKGGATALRVRGEFEEKVSKLMDRILRKAESHARRLNVAEDESNTLIDRVEDSFSLSPRNVVIDPKTLEMTIVDPK